MDISVNKLNVAYALSTWKSSDSPAVLKKVSHLVGLFDEVKKEEGAVAQGGKERQQRKGPVRKDQGPQRRKGGEEQRRCKEIKGESSPSQCAIESCR